MESSVHFCESIAGDVGIDFGGADVGVSKQFLDNPQVSAVFQEMCREAVPEHMGRHIAVNSCTPDPLLDS
jgi:hypothetical protein